MTGRSAGRRGLFGSFSSREVVRLTKLPWSRVFQMAIKNIFTRLGRSAITASGVFLGIAFLTAVLYGASAQRVMATFQLEQLGVQPAAGELQARTIWLVIMSLLVAFVGIVNSMLMSVNERYKEIGTMKCLGALDTFIVRLFLLEASLVGAIGSGLGAIAGSGLMMLVYTGRIGGEGIITAWVGTTIQLGIIEVPMWVGFVFALVLGSVISMIAAVFPAWRAAKMPAVAALCSEL